jgi:hypothetical protein
MTEDRGGEIDHGGGRIPHDAPHEPTALDHQKRHLLPGAKTTMLAAAEPVRLARQGFGRGTHPRHAEFVRSVVAPHGNGAKQATHGRLPHGCERLAWFCQDWRQRNEF